MQSSVNNTCSDQLIVECEKEKEKEKEKQIKVKYVPLNNSMQ